MVESEIEGNVAKATAVRVTDELPNILAMKPKQARRSWAVFMADHDWVSGPLLTGAEAVRLSIDMTILNLSREGEDWARAELAKEFAAFSQAWADRRGQG